MTTTTCACFFATSHPSEHDFLLGFEDLDPVKAATYLAIIIGDDDLGCHGLVDFRDDEPAAVDSYMLQSDPNEFEQFVGQHNWKDPVAMYGLARFVSDVARQAWEGRRAAETKRTRGALRTVLAETG